MFELTSISYLPFSKLVLRLSGEPKTPPTIESDLKCFPDTGSLNIGVLPEATAPLTAFIEVSETVTASLVPTRFFIFLSENTSIVNDSLPSVALSALREWVSVALPSAPTFREPLRAPLKKIFGVDALAANAVIKSCACDDISRF